MEQTKRRNLPNDFSHLNKLVDESEPENQTTLVDGYEASMTTQASMATPIHDGDSWSCRDGECELGADCPRCEVEWDETEDKSCPDLELAKANLVRETFF